MFEQFQQLAAAGVVNGSFYGLLGVGFGLILGVTGRFHYAFALVFTLAAYVASVLMSDAGMGAPVAIFVGLCAAVALGVAVEALVYRPLVKASGTLSLLTVLISSLGITIAGTNIITLIWSATSRAIPLFDISPVFIGAATVTSLDIVIVLATWIIAATMTAFLSLSNQGRSIKAVRDNPGLARVLGLDPDKVYLPVFAIGSLLCGLAGVFNGARFAVAPDMGNRPVLFAFVVAFLGGTKSSPLVICLAGLGLGLCESLSGLWVSPQWSSLVVFAILFIYLVIRPLDLGDLGRRIMSSAE
jgi:branched-subunit amino acid ABC-type transport system permease component